MVKSIEEEVLRTLSEMYQEIGFPLTAEGVANRLGCSKWTALRHLQTNQEKVSSEIGYGGIRFFKPRETKK